MYMYFTLLSNLDYSFFLSTKKIHMVLKVRINLSHNNDIKSVFKARDLFFMFEMFCRYHVCFSVHYQTLCLFVNAVKSKRTDRSQKSLNYEHKRHFLTSGKAYVMRTFQSHFLSHSLPVFPCAARKPCNINNHKMSSLD